MLIGKQIQKILFWFTERERKYFMSRNTHNIRGEGRERSRIRDDRLVHVHLVDQDNMQPDWTELDYHKNKKLYVLSARGKNLIDK